MGFRASSVRFAARLSPALPGSPQLSSPLLCPVIAVRCSFCSLQFPPLLFSSRPCFSVPAPAFQSPPLLFSPRPCFSTSLLTPCLPLSCLCPAPASPPVSTPHTCLRPTPVPTFVSALALPLSLPLSLPCLFPCAFPCLCPCSRSSRAPASASPPCLPLLSLFLCPA